MKPQSNDIRDYNHVDLLFPGKYVKAGELRGRDVTVTIESIEPRHELARTDGTKEYKPILRFAGKEKGMVLNKTNATTIAGLFGPEVSAWIGRSITIYPAHIQAFGKAHVAIRVRDRVPTDNGPIPEAVQSVPAVEDHDPMTGEVF